MKNVYFATELLGAVIILILLYANLFELKQHTKKRILFSQLLILNEIVVVADAVSWLPIEWERMPVLLWMLVGITYIVPFFMLACFSAYLYEHLSEHDKPSITPFRIVTWYSVIVGTGCLILCVTGKLFTVQDGKYYAGSYQEMYYLMYIMTLLFFSWIILSHGKKLGLHDTLGALSFCMVPLISVMIAISDVGFNPAMIFMAIDMLVIFVLLQSERESALVHDSNTDELTGLFNRRAYEDDMLQYPDVPPEPDFVYASIDINGLKQVNDTRGHAAGDELICGAAYCLKRTFGNYGRIYRTGGDEFVAMFFADEMHLKQLLGDLKELSGNWHGELVDSLALSVGYAEKREFTDKTVAEMSKEADQRMYKDKELYYSKRGTDRRGQNEAHKMLCALYTKILKINLTDDSFAVINMDTGEQIEEKGYSERISQWLTNFGKSGQVHPDDLKNYLAKTDMDYMRAYFRRQQPILTVAYRRKYGDEFRPTLMELIPAKDYSDENQSLYLYVKHIDI